MKTKLIAALLFISILFTLGMMIFSSSGSFNPGEAGFYGALASGAIFFGLMYLVLSRNFK